MYICSVKGCRNYKSVIKIGDNDHHITMHRLPRQIERREEWMNFCGQDTPISPSARLCSEHFSEDDFIGDLKFRMGFTKTRTIKKTAVPIIFEPPVRCEPNSTVYEDVGVEYINTLEYQPHINQIQIQETSKNNYEVLINDIEPEPEYETFEIEPQDCEILETPVKSNDIVNTQSCDEEDDVDYCLDDLITILRPKSVELEYDKITSSPEEKLIEVAIPFRSSKKSKRKTFQNKPKTPAKKKRISIEDLEEEEDSVCCDGIEEPIKDKTGKIRDCSMTAEESFLVDELENIVLEKIKKNLADMRLETESLTASEAALSKKRKELESESKTLQKEIKTLEERLKIVQLNKERLMITDKNAGKTNSNKHKNYSIPTQNFKTEYEQFIGLKK